MLHRNESAKAVVTFTVHEAPNPAADRIDRADELVFVKDGFSWLTAVFPPAGLLARSLWLALAAYLAAVAVICGVLTAFGVSESWMSLAIMALGLLLGFEISSIERFMLDRAGWRMLGSVTGRSLADCERRFFETWLPDQPVITASKPGQPHGGRGSLPFGAKA